MMGFKERTFAPLVAVSLEELVPQDHFYRHVQTGFQATRRFCVSRMGRTTSLTCTEKCN
jgi:hypothetical protein